MVASDWVTWLARLIVIVAACLAVVPLVKRSAARRLTFGVFAAGIAFALIPSALQVLRFTCEFRPGRSFLFLTRMDAPGFALILFGVVLGLRVSFRDKDRLQRENVALQREASTDFLTGLFNRRQAEALLDYGASRVRRSHDPLGFVMIDLDHFKRVNDTAGHQAGDAVLSHVGKLLKSRARSGDIVARYGGEEFLLVVAEPNPEVIVAFAEDLRRLIEQSPVEYGGQHVSITASFGVAICLNDTGEAVKECIGKADAALYAAKALGRNRVVSWDQAFQQADEPAKDLIREALAGAHTVAAGV